MQASRSSRYDRLIEDPDALYITFDNVAVGRIEAEEIMKVPEGNFVIIKGDSADANARLPPRRAWSRQASRRSTPRTRAAR